MSCVFLVLSSFAIVAFGQPAWVGGLGVLASAFGIALFWRAAFTFEKRLHRFLLGAIWFGSVQAVQLSWMSSDAYMGPMILVVYLFLCLAVGAQFGLLSVILEKRIGWREVLSVASAWVLMEWSRLFFLSGFTWNPVGLSLAGNYSIQFASLFGIYGLSFWVIFVNALALRCLLEKTKRSIAIWVCLAAIPYGFGFAQKKWVETALSEKTISVALVQTALLPEEKDYMPHLADAFLPPLDQWTRVLELLKGKRAELIILPEAAFPFGAKRTFYPLEAVEQFWRDHFGRDSLSDFPPLDAPFAKLASEKWKVNNSFLAQALSNHFQAELIVGLDDFDPLDGKKYNAAFLFRPGKDPQRCEKRVLVPVGEYVPLRELKFFADFVALQFGIEDSFDVGKGAKVFEAKTPVAVSICCEETYSGLIRELRLKGANLLVNISNDAWFPNSKLPRHHVSHGKVRAAENGVCVFRACNTGTTCAIDCFGSEVAALPTSDEYLGVLYLSFKTRNFKTLYTELGDGLVLSLSAGLLFFGLLYRKKKLL